MEAAISSEGAVSMATLCRIYSHPLCIQRKDRLYAAIHQPLVPLGFDNSAPLLAIPAPLSAVLLPLQGPYGIYFTLNVYKKSEKCDRMIAPIYETTIEHSRVDAFHEAANLYNSMILKR